MERDTLADQCKIEEWRQLEGIIGRRSEFAFKIRSWLLALLTAISVALLSKQISINRYLFLIIAYSIIVVFYWMELTQMVIAKRAIKRKQYVEMALRGEANYDGPRTTTELTPTEQFITLVKDIFSELKNAILLVPTLLLFGIMTLLSFLSP